MPDKLKVTVLPQFNRPLRVRHQRSCGGSGQPRAVKGIVTDWRLRPNVYEIIGPDGVIQHLESTNQQVSTVKEGVGLRMSLTDYRTPPQCRGQPNKDTKTTQRPGGRGFGRPRAK